MSLWNQYDKHVLQQFITVGTHTPILDIILTGFLCTFRDILKRAIFLGNFWCPLEIHHFIWCELFSLIIVFHIFPEPKLKTVSELVLQLYYYLASDGLVLPIVSKVFVDAGLDITMGSVDCAGAKILVRFDDGDGVVVVEGFQGSEL